MKNNDLFSQLCGVLQRIIPNVVIGSFQLEPHHFLLMPEAAAAELRPFVNWSVVAFAVPITDEGLWIWHQHGAYRSLMANYVLIRAVDTLQKELPQDLVIEDLPKLVEQKVSMTQVGELAGLGTRGWNNLLLHPEYGSWLQIHAVLVDQQMTYSKQLDFSVCIHCSLCIDACPVNALEVERFVPIRCQSVVASPWKAKSRAVALTQHTYIECNECISSCPIGIKPEGVFAWKR